MIHGKRTNGATTIFSENGGSNRSWNQYYSSHDVSHVELLTLALF